MELGVIADLSPNRGSAWRVSRLAKLNLDDGVGRRRGVPFGVSRLNELNLDDAVARRWGVPAYMYGVVAC